MVPSAFETSALVSTSPATVALSLCYFYANETSRACARLPRLSFPLGITSDKISTAFSRHSRFRGCRGGVVRVDYARGNGIAKIATDFRTISFHLSGKARARAQLSTSERDTFNSLPTVLQERTKTAKGTISRPYNAPFRFAHFIFILHPLLFASLSLSLLLSAFLLLFPVLLLYRE